MAQVYGYILCLTLLDNGTHLVKVHFASVLENQLVFMPGENSGTIYGGIILLFEQYTAII